MPISIASLTADRRTIKVPFGDEHLTLVYKPSAVNAKQEARELDERAKGQHILSQARSLAEIILSWDVLDDSGKPLPVNEETLAMLGLEVTAKLTQAILADLLPNQKTPPSSNGTSQPAASSGNARSGT